MNQMQTFEKALVARGSIRVQDAKSTRYVVLTRVNTPGIFYYLGPAGALRVGRTIAGSIPCSDKFKARLKEEAVGKMIEPHA